MSYFSEPNNVKEIVPSYTLINSSILLHPLRKGYGPIKVDFLSIKIISISKVCNLIIPSKY